MTLPDGNRVAPSILSADFARLGAQVAEVLDAGARVIHVDVMDGDFVPPITIGPLIVSAIADLVHDAGAAIDVHLMIERPGAPGRRVRPGGRRLDHRPRGGDGARRIASLGAIHEAGCGAGVAINPGTPVEALADVAADADLLLCMSVNPGWGGQVFIPASAGKVEADGGARAPTPRSRSTAASTPPPPRSVAKQGASLFVAGSAIFGKPDPAAAYAEIAAAVAST